MPDHIPAPAPVVVLAFHPVMATEDAEVFAPDQAPAERDKRIGSDKLVALEVEIVAEPSDSLFRKREADRLFVGTIRGAKEWLDERGYQYVLGSNARWAA